MFSKAFPIFILILLNCQILNVKYTWFVLLILHLKFIKIRVHIYIIVINLVFFIS